MMMMMIISSWNGIRIGSSQGNQQAVFFEKKDLKSNK